MGISTKNLEKRDRAFTRKLILFGLVSLWLLSIIGVCFIIAIAQTSNTSDILLKVLIYSVLPICFSSYIIIRYYKTLMIDES